VNIIITTTADLSLVWHISTCVHVLSEI
jgi:hypothetical protein